MRKFTPQTKTRWTGRDSLKRKPFKAPKDGGYVFFWFCSNMFLQDNDFLKERGWIHHFQKKHDWSSMSPFLCFFHHLLFWKDINKALFCFTNKNRAMSCRNMNLTFFLRDSSLDASPSFLSARRVARPWDLLKGRMARSGVMFLPWPKLLDARCVK